MSAFRRFLGILIMTAGVMGFILSVGGLIAVWVVRPQITSSITNTVNTIDNSITTSKNVLTITEQALTATVSSVDSLSSMLETTATTVEDTQPVFTQVNSMLADTLPVTMQDVSTSIKGAQDAAVVLESSLASLENFQTLVGSLPGFSSLIVKPPQNDTIEKPLSESLGDLAKNLESLPKTFSDMSVSLDNADNNLVLLQTNLTTMSTSVNTISINLGEYQAVIGDSQQSMDNLQSIITNIKKNLPLFTRVTMAVLTVFLLWLIAVQVVIWSQGLELYRGTTRSFALAEDKVVDPVIKTDGDDHIDAKVD